ncbi:MAG: hypothetical protein QOJ32_1929 [Frankiaceae bacterium]|nr:hypothetical protein [Frankiaceae bacterium]
MSASLDRLAAGLREAGMPVQGAPTPVPTGHADRPVLVWDLAEARGRCGTNHVVVKRYPAQRRAAAAVTWQLWCSSFGASRHPPGLPEPLAWLPEQRALVMALVEGTPMADRGTLPGPETHAAVAHLLADLHRSGVVPGQKRGNEKVVASVRRKAADLAGSAVGAEMQVLAESLSRCQPEDPPLVACHGDFNPRNVIGGRAGPVLIDLDRVQWADPLRDVAYYGTWCYVTARGATGIGDAEHWRAADEFTSAYEAASGGPADPRRVRFHRAAALARVVHAWSALRSDPGTQRGLLQEALRLLDQR